MSDAEKSMPHAVGIEKSVLSVAMQYPEAADECPQLCADHFHLPGHRIIFERIRTIRSSGKPLDLVEFVQDLISTGLIERVGGPSAVYDTYGHATTPTHFVHHVSKLSEFRAFRAAIVAAERLEGAALNHDTEMVSDALTAATSAITDALTDGVPARSTATIISESITGFESRVKRHEASMGIPTIKELDEVIHGLQPGRVYIPCAFSKGGKSVFASQIIVDAVTNGIPGMFLTMEMSDVSIMDRMIIQAVKMPAEAFTSPQSYAAKHGLATTDIATMRSVNRAAETLAESPLAVVRPANRRIETIVAAVRKQHREIGIKVTAIDYAQLIKCPGKTGVEEVTEISHVIQQLAQDLGIAIIMPSQLNSDGDTKNGRVFEEDAALVLNIVQDMNKESDTYRQHRHMMIVADRFYGSNGTRIPIILDRERIRFVPGEDATEANKPKKPQFNR